MYSHNIESLPQELVLDILYALKLKDLYQVIQVSKRFSLVLENIPFWGGKIKEYFPGKLQTNTPSYEYFKTVYLKMGNSNKILNKNTITDPLRFRKLFLAVCEGDKETLVRENTSFDDLFSRNQWLISLVHWSKHYSQSVRDLFYEIIREACITDSILDLKREIEDKTILHWAIHFHQSIQTIKQLVEQFIEAGLNLDDFRSPILFDAIYAKKKEIIVLLLEHVKNIDAFDSLGKTALLEAINSEDVDIVKALVEHNANVNLVPNKLEDFMYVSGVLDEDPPLCRAIKLGNLPIVQCLVEAKADIWKMNRDNLNAIDLVILYEHHEISAYLNNYFPFFAEEIRIRAEHQKNCQKFVMACKTQNVEEAIQLIDDGLDPDSLIYPNLRFLIHSAAKYGKVEIIKYLLERGADVNARTGSGATALLLAMEQRHLPVIELLLQYKADCSICLIMSTNYHTKHALGIDETPLHYAVGINRIDILKLLLINKTNPNQNTYIGTPLHYAARLGLIDHAALLLRHGAEIDALKNFTSTPLDLAISHDQVEMLKFLLSKGANPKRVNINGITPLDLAMQIGNENITNILLQHLDPESSSLTKINTDENACKFINRNEIKKDKSPETIYIYQQNQEDSESENQIIERYHKDDIAQKLKDYTSCGNWFLSISSCILSFGTFRLGLNKLLLAQKIMETLETLEKDVDVTDKQLTNFKEEHSHLLEMEYHRSCFFGSRYKNVSNGVENYVEGELGGILKAPFFS